MSEINCKNCGWELKEECTWPGTYCLSTGLNHWKPKDTTMTEEEKLEIRCSSGLLMPGCRYMTFGNGFTGCSLRPGFCGFQRPKVPSIQEDKTGLDLPNAETLNPNAPFPGYKKGPITTTNVPENTIYHQTVEPFCLDGFQCERFGKDTGVGTFTCDGEALIKSIHARCHCTHLRKEKVDPWIKITEEIVRVFTPLSAPVTGEIQEIVEKYFKCEPKG